MALASPSEASGRFLVGRRDLGARSEFGGEFGGDFAESLPGSWGGFLGAFGSTSASSIPTRPE